MFKDAVIPVAASEDEMIHLGFKELEKSYGAVPVGRSWDL